MALLPWHWPFPSNYVDEQDTDDSEQSASHQLPAAVATPVTKRKSLGSLLEHYNNPGVAPPSARIDPLLNQEIRKPFRLLDLWKYGYFVASKGVGLSGQKLRSTHYDLGAEIFADVMSHYIWGPRRPSWGIEMTLISSLMRNTNRHTQLADIVSNANERLWSFCVGAYTACLLTLISSDHYTCCYANRWTCSIALKRYGHPSYFSCPKTWASRTPS